MGEVEGRVYSPREDSGMTDKTCSCDDEFGYHDCEVHVGCDRKCKALNDPVTEDELRAALEHWRSHGYLAGCSHAC